MLTIYPSTQYCTVPEVAIYVESVVQVIMHEHVPAAVSLAEIQDATSNDPVLMQLAQDIRRDRLQQRGINTELFLKVFPELSCVENVILRGNRIKVPASMQDRMISICTETRLEIAKSQHLLRCEVWFPGVDRKMEDKCKSCMACRAMIENRQRTPLIITELCQKNGNI